MGAKAKHYRINAESGVSLSGLIVVLAVVGVVALVAIKVTPAVLEYRAVKQSIARAKATGGSNREIQQTFDKNADINSIDAIQGRDLMISRDNGTPEVSFRYERRVPLMGNVSLLFDFAGTTDPSGTVPEAETAAAK